MSKHILRKRHSGFTIVSNNVINVLKGNLEALGLYLHLLSLPDNWEFYKTHLCKEYQIGIKKLEKLLKVLASFELVQYGQKRNEKGQFEAFYMDIYDLDTIKINKLEENSPDGHFCRTAKTVRRSGEAIKEVLKKEVKKEIKEREIARKKREPLPDNFILNKENSQRCKERSINEVQFLTKFKLKQKGKLNSDWQNEAKIWIETENVQKNSEKIEPVRPKYRDFTEERLMREAMEKKSHGSEIPRDHTGREYL